MLQINQQQRHLGRGGRRGRRTPRANHYTETPLALRRAGRATKGLIIGRLCAALRELPRAVDL